MRKLSQMNDEKISPQSLHIKALAPNLRTEVIASKQPILANLEINKNAEVQGIGMGVLADGTPYLNQRGLASLCGIENAHIGTISSQWNKSSKSSKSRIQIIKDILKKAGYSLDAAHIEAEHRNVKHFCYPAELCLAVLEYYAFDAGANCQKEARDNYRLLAGSKLRDLIYSQVGYSSDGINAEPLRKWHERIELNHQSAPLGYFSIFNETNTVIYELIKAGAPIGEKLIPDISIGSLWAKYWKARELDEKYGGREKFPHRYPDDHPQSKSNPQIANCYPLEALGAFRRWLHEEYICEGKLYKYLESKNKDILPSVSQLAISRLSRDSSI